MDPSRDDPHRLMMAAGSDLEFLIATTMAISGMFTVLAWNVVFPDRRDSTVLGTLPVRTRTIFLARTGAIATALGISIFAVNVFTGLALPVVSVSKDAGAVTLLRSFAGYWIGMTAAGVFVASALLAAQGLAAQLLSYRLFLRVSSFLQLAALFLILGVYFLTPPLATVRGLTAPENQRLLAFLPSYWFLGLFQQLSGRAHPAFDALAARALSGLALAFAIAAVTCALAYRRNIRRIVEQPDITPADRSRPAARIAVLLARRFLSTALDRAILLFVGRTIARSRQHRLVLAVYAGIGLAIALAYAKRSSMAIRASPGTS